MIQNNSILLINLFRITAVCNPPCVNGVCNETTFTCDCEDNFEGSDCSVPSMCIIVLCIWTVLDSDTFNFCFHSLQSSLCQWSMQCYHIHLWLWRQLQRLWLQYSQYVYPFVYVLTLLLTCFTTWLFVIHHVLMELVLKLPWWYMLFFHSCFTVCNPPCINGTCNKTTFTCDCADNFEGIDCSSPSMYLCLAHIHLALLCTLLHVLFLHSLQYSMC